MSLVNRFVSIFRAKVNTVLDELEDPKEGLEYSLVEMREQVNKIGKSIVDVSVIKKKLEGDLEDVKNKIKLLDEHTEMAVHADREELAREALEKKHDLLEQGQRLGNQINELNNKTRSINENKEKLEKKISELKIKKDELIAMNAVADAQLKVKETLTGISNDMTNIGERFDRIEYKIKKKSARIDAIDELVDMGVLNNGDEKDSIEKELKKLQREEQIREELERLKKKSEGVNA